MISGLSSRKVFVRVDFNVPINKDGIITDDTRIVKSLPTIQKLINEKAKIILLSHLGRPLKDLQEDGSINLKKYSLEPVAKRLSEIIAVPVYFAKDCGGSDSIEKISNLKDGEIVLLENTRFKKQEEKGDPDWAKELAGLAEYYINDAFGAAHREHATTATIARFFDSSHKSFGILMEAELDNAARVINHPKRPLTAIVGGAKVSDKIDLLKNLTGFCNDIIIGGGMAYTFLAARGISIGLSICESDKLELARSILSLAEQQHCNIHLPVDSICADRFANDANILTTESEHIPDQYMALDIGPKSIERFTDVIRNSKTIIWNGPMGVFEMPNFEKGTSVIANVVADTTQHKGAFSLIGGGDSVAAINKFGLAEKVSFVSTGGGAMLELLEGKILPGVAAIKN